MQDRWRDEWDDQPVGYKGGTRWNRGRNNYLAIMLGMIGAFMTIGAVGYFSLPRLLGALCVVSSAVVIFRSDRAAKKHEDGTRYTPLRVEVLWVLAATLLCVGGAAVFLAFA